jgi:hypothetical protein
MVIGEYMTTQNYLMINQSTNIVEDICIWDGNSETWQPPENTLMLVQATTPAMIWQDVREIDPVTGKSIVVDYVLSQINGAACIGFSWNGTACVTSEPKPQV